MYVLCYALLCSAVPPPMWMHASCRLILHVQTDWLAGAWGFLIASVELCGASAGLLLSTVLFGSQAGAGSDRELFFYTMRCV